MVRGSYEALTRSDALEEALYGTEERAFPQPSMSSERRIIPFQMHNADSPISHEDSYEVLVPVYSPPAGLSAGVTAPL